MRILIGGLALMICAGAAALPSQIVIDLSLTPRAAARLSQLGESITISAMYSGEATAAHRRDADDMGEIWLGMDRTTVAGRTQRIVTRVRALKRARLSWIARGEPHLLINLFSARRKVRNNLLNCGIYDGPLAAVANTPIAISCDLI